MALQGPIPVEFALAFPDGVYAAGVFEPVRDFDASANGRFVQSKDKATGLPLWTVEVTDADKEARTRTVKVKIAADFDEAGRRVRLTGEGARWIKAKPLCGLPEGIFSVASVGLVCATAASCRAHRFRELGYREEQEVAGFPMWEGRRNLATWLTPSATTTAMNVAVSPACCVPYRDGCASAVAAARARGWRAAQGPRLLSLRGRR